MNTSNWRNGLFGSAALVLAAGTAWAQQPPAHMADMTAGDNGQAKQQVQDVARKRESEAMDSGGKMVQVPERALFMLSATPGTYFHKAVEDLEKTPGKVREDIGMAASVFQLEAARADGDVKSRMEATAQDLFHLSEQVETRQVLSKDKLEQSFGKAMHTLAEFENQQAEQGLAAKDAERLGWGVRLANYDLIESLVYTKHDPSPQVSRALFDGDTLGEQLIHLAKPTTGQLESRHGGDAQTAGAVQPPDATAKRGAEPLGSNQVQQAATLPAEADRVVKDMAEALRQTATQVDGGK